MIKSIRIKNLKVLQDTRDCQVGKITLLTGINGRGKSSFLQALLLLSQSLRHTGGSPVALFPNGQWCELGSFQELINIYSENKEIYIGIKSDDGKMFWGVGTNTDIIRASADALLSAYNNLKTEA